MKKDILDQIETVVKCTVCGKYKKLDQVKKIPTKSLSSLFDKTKIDYKFVCVECLE